MYNHKAGLGLFYPITSQVKGHPFEALLPEDFTITGAILSDQIRSLGWRVLKVKRFAKAPKEVVGEVLAKILAPGRGRPASVHLFGSMLS